MKKFLKYCLFVLPALALVFIIVISCDKEMGLKIKDIKPDKNVTPVEPPVIFSGWEHDTWYIYRSAHPDYLGDSTFLLEVYYSSTEQELIVELSVVEAVPGDEVMSFLFVDYGIDEYDDSLYFEIPDGDKVWVIDFYQYDINIGEGPVIVKCNCVGCVSLSCQVDYSNQGKTAACRSSECTCEGNTPSNCKLWQLSGPVPTGWDGPVGIIRSNNIRFGGVLYQ